MKQTRIARASAAAVALLLMSTACAAERSGSADTGAGGGTDASPAASAGEKFGTLPSPCGEGDASGATDQGVTDDAITIGYGDDRGFTAAPGLSKEMGDAVDAMIAWCNDQGGINGRQIKGIRYDAAYMQAPQVMQKACKEVFMLVGQGFAMDEAAEPIRVGCNLPEVAGYTVGPNAAMGPMKFEPVPYPSDRYNTAPLNVAGKVFPAWKSKMDVLLSTSPAVTAGTTKVTTALKGLGVTPLGCGVRLNDAGEANYVPFAEKLKKCGAQALFTSDTPDAGQFSLLESMDRIGYHPDKFFEATWYSKAVADWNKGSGAADGLTVGLAFQPLENADHVEAVKQYLDLVQARGGKIALLGMQATSAFLLWATAAKECGADLTRQCMVDNLSKIHDWTGGGLHAPTDPGANLPASCALAVQLTGGEWKQVYPENVGEFDCNDSYVTETPKELWNADLNEDRVSTKFLTDKVITPSS